MVLEGIYRGRDLRVTRRFYEWMETEAVGMKEFNLEDRRRRYRAGDEEDALWYDLSMGLSVGWLGVSLRPRDLQVGEGVTAAEVPTGDAAFDQEFVLSGRVGESVVERMRTFEMQTLLEEAPLAFDIQRGRIHFFMHHEVLKRREEELEAILKELAAFADRLDESLRS